MPHNKNLILKKTSLERENCNSDKKLGKQTPLFSDKNSRINLRSKTLRHAICLCYQPKHNHNNEETKINLFNYECFKVHKKTASSFGSKLLKVMQLSERLSFF